MSDLYLSHSLLPFDEEKMAEILQIDEVERESLSYRERAVVKRTYKESFLRKYYPENENLTADSKHLTFEMMNIPGNAYRPYEVTLYLPVKITKNDNTDYSALDAPNPATPTNHARFKNFAGVDLIRDVKVYPSNGANVEHLKPEHTPCIEMMRYYLQLNQDEKEEEFFSESQMLNFPLITSDNPTKVGKSANLTAIDLQAREFEEFTRDRWQVLQLKIPSGFFENMSLIPSSLPLRVELTLASNANSLLCRLAHAAGTGNQSGTANIANAKYRIDPTQTYLAVTYYRLPDGRDEEGNPIEGAKNEQAIFEKQFFSSKAIKMPLFTTLRMVATNRIQQIYNPGGTKLERLLKLENAWDEHTIFGFVPYTSVTDTAGYNVENVRFIPGAIRKVQIWVDSKPLFPQGGISWNNTIDHKRQMYESLADTQGAPYRTEKRIKHPFGSSEYLDVNRWCCYVNLSPDKDSSFTDVSNHIVGPVEIELQFDAAANGAGIYIDLAMVFLSPERRYIVCQDAILNTWSSVETSAPPQSYLRNPHLSRNFS